MSAPINDTPAWATCVVVRDRDGSLWARSHGSMWVLICGDIRIGTIGLEAHYGPIVPVLDDYGLPAVTTVADLMHHHLGARITLATGENPPTVTLRGLSTFIRGEVSDFVELACEWDTDGPNCDWDYTTRPPWQRCTIIAHAGVDPDGALS